MHCHRKIKPIYFKREKWGRSRNSWLKQDWHPQADPKALCLSSRTHRVWVAMSLWPCHHSTQKTILQGITSERNFKDTLCQTMLVSFSQELLSGWEWDIISLGMSLCPWAPGEPPCLLCWSFHSVTACQPFVIHDYGWLMSSHHWHRLPSHFVLLLWWKLSGIKAMSHNGVHASCPRELFIPSLSIPSLPYLQPSVKSPTLMDRGLFCPRATSPLHTKDRFHQSAHEKDFHRCPSRSPWGQLQGLLSFPACIHIISLLL